MSQSKLLSKKKKIYTKYIHSLSHVVLPNLHQCESATNLLKPS